MTKRNRRMSHDSQGVGVITPPFGPHGRGAAQNKSLCAGGRHVANPSNEHRKIARSDPASRRKARKAHSSNWQRKNRSHNFPGVNLSVFSLSFYSIRDQKRFRLRGRSETQFGRINQGVA